MAAPKLERLKAADVCQIAQVQPYVLRTWEAEFADLGQVTAGGPRIYGRADVERVLRIRELVYVEGLTLSGARRRLEESAGDAPAAAANFSLVDATTRARLKSVRKGLLGVLALLERPVGGASFELVAVTGSTDRPVAAKAGRRGKR
ncbi:MAG: MerR family transcriptional regulator [Acidobacteria bacterium]|nr:MerR family transcriptional regulator [Acidobacteriota bacterium]